MAQPLPDLRALVAPIIGQPYAEYDCFGLVRYLLKQGFDLDMGSDPTVAAEQIIEVWFRGDAAAPWDLIQPWDAVILARYGLISGHLGLVVDHTTMVHTRPRTGVVLEPLRRWESKLVQIARLRMLDV